jgi:hypothetical protein
MKSRDESATHPGRLPAEGGAVRPTVTRRAEQRKLPGRAPAWNTRQLTLLGSPRLKAQPPPPIIRRGWHHLVTSHTAKAKSFAVLVSFFTALLSAPVPGSRPSNTSFKRARATCNRRLMVPTGVSNASAIWIRLWPRK